MEVIYRWLSEYVWRPWQTRMRRKRFLFVQRFLATLEQPCHLLDVGGTEEFWQQVAATNIDISVVIYNLATMPVSRPNFSFVQGDACDMKMFQRQQFECVFSNSVIEHVGDYAQQQQMAHEVQRVGRKYCIQTPNRSFPIEPHVLIPFFQFFPFCIQVWLLTNFRSPWGWKLENRSAAEAYVRGIRLLSEHELRMLFPAAHIYREKFFGLTKSFIVYSSSLP